MLIRVLACLKQALRVTYQLYFNIFGQITTWKVGIIGSTEKRVKVITGYMNCSSS
ncbi:hypothetical protein T09_11466 [Trichinella sp. T9]|nr:hypothetical protein T09_11466 [Trichinella sp. T9]